jgi:hypothetical protein
MEGPAKLPESPVLGFDAAFMPISPLGMPLSPMMGSLHTYTDRWSAQ